MEWLVLFAVMLGVGVYFVRDAQKKQEQRLDSYNNACELPGDDKMTLKYRAERYEMWQDARIRRRFASVLATTGALGMAASVVRLALS